MKLTADELESGLAWALDVARSEGWKPTRNKTCRSGECCALGALVAIGLVDSAMDSVHDIGRATGIKRVGGIADGFDGRSTDGEYERVGANLAAIFVDGAE